MKCEQCGTNFIHGGSHDGEDYGNEDCLIVNNYSCPDCGVFILEFIPKDDEGEDDV